MQSRPGEAQCPCTHTYTGGSGAAYPPRMLCVHLAAGELAVRSDRGDVVTTNGKVLCTSPGKMY